MLEVRGLAHGPHAVARLDGKTVFVPGAAPGDRVRARLIEDRPRWARARLVHRCHTGPAFREPPCRWTEACGGCPWQQVAYTAQLEAKAENVRQLLARIGGVTPRRALPIVAAPAEWAYRRRIRLHLDRARRLGFMRPASHEVVAIDHCHVAEPDLLAALTVLRAFLAAGHVAAAREVELVASHRGGVVVVLTCASVGSDDARRLSELVAAEPCLAGGILRAGRRRHVVGDARIDVTPDPDRPPIVQPADVFSQVNAGANVALARAVVALTAPATRVLDLFCGAGNFSVPLGRAGRTVVGVERVAEAAAHARALAAAEGLTNVRIETAPAERFLRQQGAAGAELVVLDPPRRGAPAVVTQLARLRPPRIVYVSCDPATLARDVRRLAAAGYAVDRMQPFDLFPHTEHVETVLEAVLTAL